MNFPEDTYAALHEFADRRGIKPGEAVAVMLQWAQAIQKWKDEGTKVFVEKDGETWEATFR